LAASCIGPHDPQRDASFACQGLPRRDVGVVVEFGDDDFISLAPRTPQRTGDMKRERCHVAAEGDFRRRGAQKIRERHASRVERLIGFEAAWKMPVRVRVVMHQVVGHRVDDALRHLSAARAVEIRDGLAFVDAPQRRKRSPYGVDWRNGSSGR
jgi:hypothetical protein